MRQKHRRWIITAAVLVTPLIFLLCVGIGSVNYTPAEITQVLWNEFGEICTKHPETGWQM